MKTIVETTGESLEKLMGMNVMVFCGNYIYAGKFCGLDETQVKLTNPHIVYETGPFNTKTYKDAQKLPADEWFITRTSIESMGPGKDLGC